MGTDVCYARLNSMIIMDININFPYSISELADVNDRFLQDV